MSRVLGGDYVTHASPEEAERTREALRKAPGVTWHQQLPYPEVLRTLAESHLGVLTTLDDTLGWSVLEAMSLGLPALTTDLCAMPEMVEDGKNGRTIPLPKSPTRRWAGMDLPVGSPERARALQEAYAAIEDWADRRRRAPARSSRPRPQHGRSGPGARPLGPRPRRSGPRSRGRLRGGPPWVVAITEAPSAASRRSVPPPLPPPSPPSRRGRWPPCCPWPSWPSGRPAATTPGSSRVPWPSSSPWARSPGPTTGARRRSCWAARASSPSTCCRSRGLLGTLAPLPARLNHEAQQLTGLAARDTLTTDLPATLETLPRWILLLLVVLLARNLAKDVRLRRVLLGAIALVAFLTLALGLVAPRDNTRVLWIYEIPRVEYEWRSPLLSPLHSAGFGVPVERSVGTSHLVQDVRLLDPSVPS